MERIRIKFAFPSFIMKLQWENVAQCCLQALWNLERGKRRCVTRPFDFVRFFLTDDSSGDEEPANAAEMRNITVLRLIPFVVPFMQRVEVKFGVFYLVGGCI